MHVALRHAGPRGVVSMALQAGLRAVKTPIEFPVIIMAHNERLEELQRTLSWKTLDRLRGPFDKLWGREFEVLLDRAGKAAAGAYSPGNFGTVEAAINEVFDVMSQMYDRMYRQVGGVFADRAGKAARRLLDQDQRANVFEETADARRWVREQTGSRIRNVSAATVKAAKKFVDRSFTEGLTTDQIAGGLRKQSGFSRHRAFRIARTEVVAASNAGNHFATAAVLSNERFSKVWLSSRDIRVRDSHSAADGQTVDLDDSFKLAGGRLRFPGDSTLGASAGEIIHCRCTTTHKPKKGRSRRPRQRVQPPPPQFVTPPVDPLLDIKPTDDFISLYDTTVFANEIVESAAARGMTLDAYKLLVEKHTKELLAKSDIYIRVPRKVMPRILREKQIKSQFETNKSGGLLDRKVRADKEFDFFSIPRDSDVTKRPVYGYMSDSVDGNYLGKQGDSSLKQYGNITFKMKKDVRRSTTFTGSDSLDTAVIPSPVEAPSPRSLGYFNEDPVDTKITDFLSDSYVEAQIHGGVDMSMVDSVYFTEGEEFLLFESRLKKLGIEARMRTGLPVPTKPLKKDDIEGIQ